MSQHAFLANNERYGTMHSIMINPIIIIVGTRPEGIKMLPIYEQLVCEKMPVLLVSTGQHTTLLDEVFEVFGRQPDIDLALGEPNQDLSVLTQKVIGACKELYQKYKPSLVLVEGDTTTVMAAGLVAFYQRIPLGHVEAGLRTGDIYQPYPEEFNRKVIGLIADYHFAPTALPVANLLAERVERNRIFCTGNTVVDAFRIMRAKIADKKITVREDLTSIIEQKKAQGKKVVLLTAHRRESFNGGIERILQTVKDAAQLFPDLFFIYPYHPNPNVIKAIDSVNLKSCSHIYMTEPLTYKDFVYVLLSSDFVLTDSGGVQEEAISLGKPTVVLREKTERIEGVWEGIAHLAGTDPEKIIRALHEYSNKPAQAPNSLYGDGHAAEKIVRIIQNELGHQKNDMFPDITKIKKSFDLHN